MPELPLFVLQVAAESPLSFVGSVFLDQYSRGLGGPFSAPFPAPSIHLPLLPAQGPVPVDGSFLPVEGPFLSNRRSHGVAVPFPYRQLSLVQEPASNQRL